MYSNPKENRTYINQILIDQFRRKGYTCKEVETQGSTILIMTCEKKNTTLTQVMNENYKDFLRTN